MSKNIRMFMGLTLLAFSLMLAMTSQASADADTSNDETALTLTMTPSVDRGISISSGNVALGLGTLSASISTYTVKPATITISGSYATTEVQVKCSTAGAMALANNGSASTDTGGLMLIFTSVVQASAPAAGDFNVAAAAGGGDAVQMNTYVTAGNSGTTSSGQTVTGSYEGPFTTGTGNNTSDMDGLAANTKRHVFIRLDTPTTFSAMTSTSMDIVLNFKAIAAE